MTEYLRILHLNDLHSHFENYPKVKRFFQAEVPDTIEVLKLDLGDNIDKSHPLTDATAGRANVELMNELGIQFATIGNNEGIGLAKAELDVVYDQANFQVILGNLKDKRQQPNWAQPYFIYETRQGTKIALLAYTFPYYATYEPNGWTVENPLDCLKADLARDEVASADVRILMSHLGVRYDEQIARDFPEIDLIIGSHTHHLFEEGEVVNGTYLAAADKYGYYVGEINLTLDNHQLQEASIVAHATSQMPSDWRDQDWIEQTYEHGRQLLSQEKIIDLPRDLSLADSCHLVMEAMMCYADADVCIMNSGLVVTPFEKNLTKASLQTALPHQMRLAKLTVTAKELADIYEDIWTKGQLLAHQEIRGKGFRGKQFGNVLQAGFAYKNGKIVYNGKAIDEKKELHLVLVDQYAFASYFDKVRQHQAELLFPDLLREVVADYLTGHLEP
ncbi:metallophosphoesterase [uncultured Streptococcus sp.]|uniref:bifunctional metallophosphatase/5'-nucleotidase n=1 Tax=uncultured Streptococcus sp. TaxID=83427 RepID=UPI0027DB9FE1|nr:metallophosphoesterase [uncultured Streptococcus sp.]